MSDSDARDNFSDSSSRDSILKSSRLNAPLRSSVLRPSLFTAVSNNDSCSSAAVAGDKLTSTALFEDSSSNPFLKDEPDQKTEEEDCKKENDDNKKENKKEDPLALLSKNGLPRSSLFAASKSSIPRVEQSGFVFGQNVHERVTGAIENVQNTSKESESDKQSAEKDKDSSSGTAETTTGLLFSSAIQNNKSEETSSLVATASKESGESKSLTEVAREYEESRAQKRKYEEVETFTGEENELNILDINCKLFAFVNRNWEERGRGSLRLNDSKDENGCSRVVFRTSGNLRLLVNTKVWNGMVAERPSQKSLRLTAMDNTGQIKVFLIMSRPDDIETLHKALTKRIDECKKNKDHSSNGDDVNDRKEMQEEKANVEGAQKDTVKELNENTCKSSNDDDNDDDDNDADKKKPKDDGENSDNDDQGVTAVADAGDNNGDGDDDKYEPSPKKPAVDENN